MELQSLPLEIIFEITKYCGLDAVNLSATCKFFRENIEELVKKIQNIIMEHIKKNKIDKDKKKNPLRMIYKLPIFIGGNIAFEMTYYCSSKNFEIPEYEPIVVITSINHHNDSDEKIVKVIKGRKSLKEIYKIFNCATDYVDIGETEQDEFEFELILSQLLDENLKITSVKLVEIIDRINKNFLNKEYLNLNDDDE
jgi:hypothetical protein